jgi:hypothetical protein
LGRSLPPEAVEGIVALLFIGIIIRLVDVGPKVPRKILKKITREDEDEYVLVRRRK